MRILRDIRNLLVLYFLGLTLIGTYVGVRIYGPSVEGCLRPVLSDFRASEARVETHEDGTSWLYFSDARTKLREECALHHLIYRWMYDSSAEVATVQVAATGEVFRPQTIVTAGVVRSREFMTQIPPVVRSFPEVSFIGTAYFQCHDLWLLSYSFRIVLTAPREGDVEEIWHILE